MNAVTERTDLSPNIELDDDERQRCEVWTRVMGYHRPVAPSTAARRASITSATSSASSAAPACGCRARQRRAAHRRARRRSPRLDYPGRTGWRWCSARAARGAAAIATTLTCSRAETAADLAWDEALRLPAPPPRAARRRGVLRRRADRCRPGLAAAMRAAQVPRLPHRPAQRRAFIRAASPRCCPWSTGSASTPRRRSTRTMSALPACDLAGKRRWQARASCSPAVSTASSALPGMPDSSTRRNSTASP